MAKTPMRLIVGVCVFLILTQWIVFSVDREPWFDVSFSLETAHALDTQGFGSIDFQEYDVHPPVYYMVLGEWQLVNPGASEYHWAQEFSVFIGLLFLIFIFYGLRNLFGRDGEYTALAFIPLTTYLHYATEVRMYMLVMMLSAVMLWLISLDLTASWQQFVAALVLFIIPLVHYFAALAVGFFPLLYYLRSDRDAKAKSIAVFIGMMGLLGVASALFFAIPQLLRTSGTWFSNPGLGGMTSAAFYAFFMIDNMGVAWTAVSYVVYVVFLVVFVWMLVFVILVLTGKRDEGKEIGTLILMFATVFAPMLWILMAVVGMMIFQNGLFSLYHHRLFLVLIWMFAAATILLVLRSARMIEQEHKKNILPYVTAIFLIISVVMLINYGQESHHELENMMEQTPCLYTEMAPNGLGYPKTLWIGHESPFSALPYVVYQREHGCDWVNFISTNVTQKMANAGGFDAFKGPVYWNLTLPDREFYYVRSADPTFVLGNRSQAIVDEDAGIWLVAIGGRE